MKDTKDNIVIQITAGTVIKIALVLALLYTIYLLSDLVMVIITSVVVASAVEPAAKWLIRKKVPRILSVLCVYLIFLSVFAAICFFMLPPLLQDASKFFASLPQYFDFLNRWNPWSDVIDYRTVLTNMAAEFNLASPAAQGAANAAAKTVGSIFHGLTNFVLVLVLSFYLAVQERGIENFLKIIVPQKNEKYVIDLWYRSQHKIGKWMQGQVILGVMVGVLVYLLLTILSVPQAFLLAIIAAVFELIPVFGPTISAIPAVIIGFSISGTLGFAVLLAYILIQQFENHLIYPIVVRNVVGVPPIMVILALLVGAKLAGFMGIILSVPLAAALMEFVNDIEKKKNSVAI